MGPLNKTAKPALGRISNSAYCVCMARIFTPIFPVLGAATVAILSEIVAHDCFGIAIDAIRTDALRAAVLRCHCSNVRNHSEAEQLIAVRKRFECSV